MPNAKTENSSANEEATRHMANGDALAARIYRAILGPLIASIASIAGVMVFMRGCVVQSLRPEWQHDDKVQAERFEQRLDKAQEFLLSQITAAEGRMTTRLTNIDSKLDSLLRGGR